MKRFILLFLCGAASVSVSLAQTSATATWALTADQSAVVTGNVAGTAQTLSSLQVSYSSSVQLASPVGTAGSWSAETSENSTRYMQFSVTPNASYVFNISSISMLLYGKGGSYMTANVYYSKDSSFATRTQIGSTVTLSSSKPSSANVSVNPNISVYSNETIYVRVYPWDSYASAQTGKYVIANSVIISGTTTQILVTPSANSLPSFVQQSAGVPSTVQTYTVSGSNLISNVVMTAPAGFEISTDGGTTWNGSASPITLLQSGGTIVGQPVAVSVRLNASVPATYSGAVTSASTGAPAANVNLSGALLASEPTGISTVSFSSIGGNSFVISAAGGNGSHRIVVVRADSAVTWTPTDGAAAVGVNQDFQSAVDQGNGNKVVYDGAGDTVTVYGLTTNAAYHAAVYEYNVGTGNSQNYLTSSAGIGSQTTLAIPTLTVSSSTLSFGGKVVKTVSQQQIYELNGIYLSPAAGSVQVNASSGFEISVSSDSGFSSSLAISYIDATLDTSIYVRFHPLAKTAYSGTIVNSANGAVNVPVSVNGIGMDSAYLYVKTYYVSPAGDDVNGDGTLLKPFKGVSKTALKMNPLDTLILRGGVYSPDSLVIHDATMHNLTFKAYPGERPTIRHGSYDDIILYASYSVVDGIAADSAVHNGIHIMGHYNVIKNCDFHHNGDAGLKLGAHTEFKYPRNDTIINCDAHDNYDTGTNGGNADGFAAKWAVGANNYFWGCRAWNNGDDGWDLWQADSTMVIENCWCINNGKVPAHPESAGNGNGFKLGGSPVNVHQEVKNCLSVYAYGSSGGKGFDQNNNTAGHTLLNCTAYNNAYNDYNFPTVTAGANIIQNCIAYLSTNKPKLIDIAAGGTVSNDSWLSGFSVSASDFVSLDTTGLRGARKADGSLPDVAFGHLASTSRFINAGVNVGLPYISSAPDLGCFEYGAVTDVKQGTLSAVQPSKFQLNQNYPNPFNPTTMISFSVETKGNATLKIYDLLGRQVAELFNDTAEPGKLYSVKFNAAKMSSGIYFSVLQSASQRIISKMLLTK